MDAVLSRSAPGRPQPATGQESLMFFRPLRHPDCYRRAVGATGRDQRETDMAHKSRLGCLVIDCQADEVAGAARFWGAALGGEVEVDEDGKYATVHDQGQMKVLVQAVEHGSRVHLDIEADDKEAEVARLEALGATVVARIKRWIVMEAPTGHRFCVVNPQSDLFHDLAKAWEA